MKKALFMDDDLYLLVFIQPVHKTVPGHIFPMSSTGIDIIKKGSLIGKSKRLKAAWK